MSLAAFTNVSNSGLNRIPSLGAEQLVTPQKKLAKSVHQVSQKALEEAPVPRTGSASGCCAGMVAGFVAGMLITACTSVFVWGTGTGLWVEGDRNGCDGCVLAGRIMVLYITPPLVGIGGLIGSCYGACGGFIFSEKD